MGCVSCEPLHLAGGMLYWTQRSDDAEEEDEARPRYTYSHTTSTDVEMTGYALLTTLLRNDMSKAMSIAKWLIKKQNKAGGYYSTQVRKLIGSSRPFINSWKNLLLHHCQAEFIFRKHKTTFVFSVMSKYQDGAGS